MPDVQVNAPGDCGSHFLEHVTTVIEDAAISSAKTVRYYVALGQLCKNHGQRRVCVANMNHEWKPHGGGSFLCQLQRLQVILSRDRSRETHFNAQDHVTILLNGPNGQLWVCVFQVE